MLKVGDIIILTGTKKNFVNCGVVQIYYVLKIMDRPAGPVLNLFYTNSKGDVLRNIIHNESYFQSDESWEITIQSFE